MARLKYYNASTNQWEYVDTSKTKSLYQYAIDAGFEGTEEDFADKLNASGNLISTITLLANSWIDNGNETYSQIVSIPKGKINSMIELQADSSVLLKMIDDSVISIGITNNNGVFTANTIGAAPTVDLTIQCTITEVDESTGTIVGRPITAGGSGGAGLVFGATAPTSDKDKTKFWFCNDSTSELYRTLNVYDGNEWIPIVGTFVE